MPVHTADSTNLVDVHLIGRHRSAVLPQPLQLRHAVLQHGELLRRLGPLGGRLAALARDALHFVVGEVAHDFGGQNRGQLLEQATLNGKDADIVDQGLEGDLCLWLATNASGPWGTAWW